MLSSPDCPSLVMTPPSGMPPRSQRLSETHALLCAGIHTRSQEKKCLSLVQANHLYYLFLNAGKKIKNATNELAPAGADLSLFG